MTDPDAHSPNLRETEPLCVHSPEEKKRQITRLSRVIGHLNHVKLLLQEDRDCSEVLTQLSACQSALSGLGKEIINDHISHCLYHAVQQGDTDSLEAFKKAVDRFI